MTHPVSPGAVLRQSYNQLNGIGGIDVEREASAARASLANALQHHAPVMANSGVVLDPVALSGYAAAPARSPARCRSSLRLWHRLWHRLWAPPMGTTYGHHRTPSYPRTGAAVGPETRRRVGSAGSPWIPMTSRWTVKWSARR